MPDDTRDIASRLRIKQIGSMEVVMVSSDTNVLDAVNAALDFKGQDELTPHEVVKEVQRRAKEYERKASPEFQKLKRNLRRKALEEAVERLDECPAYSDSIPLVRAWLLSRLPRRPTHSDYSVYQGRAGVQVSALPEQ